jgi:hypothetical protein
MKGHQMKYGRKSLLICCLLSLWISTAGAQDVVMRRVTNHVSTFSMSNLGMHTNVTVIETQKGLIVIETEITPYIMNVIKKAAEKKLKRNDWAYVINTHGHLHHAGGNSAFEGVQFIGHETMNMNWLKNRLLTDQGRRQYCNSMGVNSAIIGLRRSLSQTTLTTAQKKELLRKLNFCHAVKKEIMAGFKVINPTITFRDQHELDLGDIHLNLFYWGDGICHSSIFVHVAEDNMLVGMGMGGGWMPDFYGKVTLEGIRNAISVCEELINKDFKIDYMIGIHSVNILTSKQPFEHKHKYLKALLNDLTKAKQEGLTLQQTKDKLSIDTSYAFVLRDFTMPPDRNETHQKNIEKIWALLP